jgi:hypothetical protein
MEFPHLKFTIYIYSLTYVIYVYDGNPVVLARSLERLGHLGVYMVQPPLGDINGTLTDMLRCG